MMTTRRRTRPRLTECKDCHLPIRFVTLDTGSRLPVNPMPDAHGNVAAHRTGRELFGWVVSRSNPILARMDLFMPHHATCAARQPAPKPAPPPTLFDMEE